MSVWFALVGKKLGRSSNVSVKLPCSPQTVGTAAAELVVEVLESMVEVSGEDSDDCSVEVPPTTDEVLTDVVTAPAMDMEDEVVIAAREELLSVTVMKVELLLSLAELRVTAVVLIEGSLPVAACVAELCEKGAGVLLYVTGTELLSDCAEVPALVGTMMLYALEIDTAEPLDDAEPVKAEAAFDELASALLVGTMASELEDGTVVIPLALFAESDGPAAEPLVLLADVLGTANGTG